MILPKEIIFNFDGDKLTPKQALPTWAFNQVQAELNKIKNPPELVFYGMAEFDPDDEEQGNWWLDSLEARVSCQFYVCEDCETFHLNEVKCCGDHTGDFLKNEMLGEVLARYM